MPSEKQIAANRRNAQRSKGPRSAAGKKRSSQNAFRHGLSKPIVGAEFARTVAALAHDIAGDATDRLTLELAREAAAAIAELERVRRMEVALIARVSAFGRLELPRIFRTSMDEAAWIMLHDWGVKLWKNRPQFAADDVPEMPANEPERTAEAVRRALPELVRLQRYERRAAARRDRAIRRFVQRESHN